MGVLESTAATEAPAGVTSWQRAARLWVVVAIFTVIGILRSIHVDIPFKDPHGAYLLSRVGLTLGIGAVWVLVDTLVRSGRPLQAGRVRATFKERWTPRRFALVGVALAAYHATYFVYHNLKSWDVLNAPRDAMLTRWDEWIFLGHSPAVLLHDLLGQNVSAWTLMVWYESFGTLVILTFPAAAIFAPRIKDAYASIAAFVWVWILGTASYYLIPSLGPFNERPQDFAGLPHMSIQDTQARYMGQRAHLLADPQAHDAFAQVSAFASLHVGVSAVILGVAWWYRLRRTTIAMSIFLAGTCVATVYLGWHFFVDVPAGLAIAALSWWLGPLTVGARRPARRPAAEVNA